jgi:3-phenylpropionate/trans-cinnamate dioxygenase ferredoxin reductase subunit
VSAFDVIIIGAGEAGVATALSLRGSGFNGSIKLLGGEQDWTYHRPPLSKGFLEGTEDRASIRSAGPEDFGALNVEASFGVSVERLDREAREVTIGDEVITYGHLVIATGSRNRSIADPSIAGILQLRTVGDAEQLRDGLRLHSRLVIVGAGFLGLEVASIAADLGLQVDVVELATSPLGGKVSSATVQAVESYLRSRGIQFSLGVGVDEFVHDCGQLTGVRLSDGRLLDTRLALTCVGVVPNMDLAQEAGLNVGNGIEVDEYLISTNDPHISVVGDVASYPATDGGRVRVESIANALAQAQCVAERLSGAPSSYSAVPWFWSVYGPHRLELVGLGTDIDEVIVHGDPLKQDFAAYCFLEGQLVRFESLNRPREHMKMRRAFERGYLPSAEEIGRPNFSLADWSLTPIS